jgi:hypothetical protein
VRAENLFSIRFHQLEFNFIWHLTRTVVIRVMRDVDIEVWVCYVVVQLFGWAKRFHSCMLLFVCNSRVKGCFVVWLSV